MFWSVALLVVASPTPSPPPVALSVLLGGDVMLNGISTKQKPLEHLRSILRPAGVAIVNLEIPLTVATRATPNKSADELRRRQQFVLKADPGHAKELATVGVDLVSLGNNHAMDYRRQGLEEMRARLSELGILFCGAGDDREEALRPAVYEAQNGVRVGLISALAFMGHGALASCTPAGPNLPGVATLPFGGVVDEKAEAYLQDLVEQAKGECDLLIVGLHWGLERQSVPTDYQVKLGRAWIDAGADVVWGNHPHVLQGAEIYKGKPIVYSMGNLISPRGGPSGLLKLVFGSEGFLWAQFLPLTISGGKVKPVNGKPGQAAVIAFEGLCASVVRRYPHKSGIALLPPRQALLTRSSRATAKTIKNNR